MFEDLRKLMARDIRPDHYFWHRYYPLFPFLLILTNGTRAEMNGQVWRRRNRLERRWEYRQDEETLEEFVDRW